MLRDLLCRWLVPQLQGSPVPSAFPADRVKKMALPGAVGSLEPAFKAGALLIISILFDFEFPIEQAPTGGMPRHRPASLECFWTSVADLNGAAIALVKFERRIAISRRALYAAVEWRPAPVDGASLRTPYLRSFPLLEQGAI